MRTNEVIESGYFISAVDKVLRSLFPGDDTAELAALLIRDNNQQERRVLVATPLGTLDVSLDLAQRDHRMELEPVRVTLIAWDDWPHLTLTGLAHATSSTDSFDVIWEIAGLPGEVELAHPNRRARELADFARVCLEHRPPA